MQVGKLAGSFTPGDDARNLRVGWSLRDYAEKLYPWARKVSSRMLGMIDTRSEQAWSQLGTAISAGLHRELRYAPVGRTLEQLLDENVGLIQSIPLKAEARLQRIALGLVTEGRRAAELIEEIKASGQVAESHAMTIARTETSRASTTLMQARAMHVGSEGYTWETSHDSTVRPSHRKMQGVFVRWDDPPTLDGLRGHAGCLPNCRCWSRIVLPGTE